MKYTSKTFTLPVATPTKRPCKVHHIVKGKCLRCDHVVKGISLSEETKALLAPDMVRFAAKLEDEKS
jgi:hypothetical protein